MLVRDPVPIMLHERVTLRICPVDFGMMLPSKYGRSLELTSACIGILACGFISTRSLMVTCAIVEEQIRKRNAIKKQWFEKNNGCVLIMPRDIF